MARVALEDGVGSKNTDSVDGVGVVLGEVHGACQWRIVVGE